MRLTPPFIDGVLLGVSAVPDALLVVDAPRCEMERAFVWDSLHDWQARLTGDGPYSRNRRVYANDWREGRHVTGTEDRLRETILAAASMSPGSPVILDRGFMSLFVNTDLPGVAAGLRERISGPLLVVDGHSADDDWVDGWRALHDVVLGHLTREEGEAEVVVTGFLMQRQEGDERGNVAELRRLLSVAGVPEPVWPLSGGPLLQTPFVSPRATRLAFCRDDDRAAPGEEEVLPLDLPVGVEGTSAFLRTLASRFESASAVERHIEEERRRCRDLLLRPAARTLAGKGAVVVGDPWRVFALSRALRELGLDVPLAVVLRRADAPLPGRERLEADGTEVLQFPEAEEVRERLLSGAKKGSFHVMVGSGLFCEMARAAGLPSVETAMPFRLEHFTAPAPWMGFEGLLRLADRLFRAIEQRERP